MKFTSFAYIVNVVIVVFIAHTPLTADYGDVSAAEGAEGAGSAAVDATLTADCAEFAGGRLFALLECVSGFR